MKGIKGNEQSILLAISDSFISIEQIALNNPETLTEIEMEQLKGMRSILEANKDILSPYYKEMISKMSDYIVEYLLRQ